MDKVVQKIENYFGHYEFGVYKEAEGDGKDGAVWKVKQHDKTIPYLRAMNARGRHIFVRPTYEREPHYMLHDDLDKKGLDRHHKQDGKWKPGRMVVESSPGNYQVWIHPDRPLSNEEKSHWLKKMDSDPGASPKHRWGRAPGYRNRKDKYEDHGRYPLAKLVWVDWRGKARVPKVDLHKQEIEQPPRQSVLKAYAGRSGSSGALPKRSDFERGNESRTDYAYMLALMRRGVSDGEVEKRIRDERTDWSHHQSDKAKDHYFEFSLHRARTLIESTPSKQRQDWKHHPPGRSQDAYSKRTLDRAEGIISSTPATPRQSRRRDPGRLADDDISSQAYRIVVKNVDMNTERSTVVEDLKEKEAKAIVEERARVMAVQVGFEKASDIRVDVEPVKAQGHHNKKDLNLSLYQ